MNRRKAVLIREIFAGFVKVEFVDFWLADQFNSLVGIFMDTQVRVQNGKNFGWPRFFRKLLIRKLKLEHLNFYASEQDKTPLIFRRASAKCSQKVCTLRKFFLCFLSSHPELSLLPKSNETSPAVIELSSSLGSLHSFRLAHLELIF